MSVYLTESEEPLLHAGLVRPTEGQLVWILDTEAASLLLYFASLLLTNASYLFHTFEMVNIFVIMNGLLFWTLSFTLSIIQLYGLPSVLCEYGLSSTS